MEEKFELGKIKYCGTNDYVAKCVWSNPINFKNLVYKTLGIELSEDNIEYSINEDKKEVNGKLNQYDVTVKYGQDMNMLVETQTYGNDNRNEYSDYIINRSIHYVCSTHCNLYAEGDKYKVNKYTYLIWVCTFEIPGDEGISVFSVNNGNIEFDRIKIVFVSLPNIKKDVKIESSTREFFNVLEATDLQQFEKSDSEVIELAKTISKVNTVRDELFLAELAEMKKNALLTELEIESEKARKRGLEQGIAQGLEQGIAQGIEKGKQDLILAMLNNGLTPEMIANSTGLDLELVLEIERNK